MSWFWFRIFSVRSLVYLHKKHRQVVICQKWIPSFHRNNLRTKTEKFFVRFFRFSAETFQSSSYLLAGNSVGTALWVSTVINWEKGRFFFILDDEFKNFGLLAKTIDMFVIGTFWGKKLTCFSFFLDLERTFFYKFRPKAWGKSVGTAL